MAKIDKTYHGLLEKILTKGFKYDDPNRKGVQRIQIPSFTLEHSFDDGFPQLSTKKMFTKGITVELLWFLKGDTNIKYLVDNDVNIWNKDAYNHYKRTIKDTPHERSQVDFKEFVNLIKTHTRQELEWGPRWYSLGDLGPVYGKQWRDWTSEKYLDSSKFYSNVDQFKDLIASLRKTPMGTRSLVSAWNPGELSSMALPPCHWAFHVLPEPISAVERENMYAARHNYSEQERCEMHPNHTDDQVHVKMTEAGIPSHAFTLKWHQNSVDTFLGLPFNIASYAILARLIGDLTGMVPLGIIGDLSNVHIYTDHLDAVNEQLSRDPNKHPNSKFICYTTEEARECDGDVDKFLDMLTYENFEPDASYTHYPPIKAEMLAYTE